MRSPVWCVAGEWAAARRHRMWPMCALCGGMHRWLCTPLPGYFAHLPAFPLPTPRLHLRSFPRRPLRVSCVRPRLPPPLLFVCISVCACPNLRVRSFGTSPLAARPSRSLRRVSPFASPHLPRAVRPPPRVTLSPPLRLSMCVCVYVHLSVCGPGCVRACVLLAACCAWSSDRLRVRPQGGARAWPGVLRHLCHARAPWRPASCKKKKEQEKTRAKAAPQMRRATRGTDM
ncbi:hypothetical protein H696_02640 [Fonticula alba]|uniref:Uncharacterized protein n=1 Tax=Fonticula alba TaxID=691883 RepID=A0A058Z861_FONAL|nr:hypothetical protein H696_02640 [Fonticula alba]KCV70311.1 hypothetical protein H696_02640 [Fonticula alba]|eukprot:XP_009494827.1 hypothetical protein H696_02640 [Fonticula alba]